jgi:hypothetical protein
MAGGRNPLRKPHAAETIERLRAAGRRHWADPDARTRQSELTKRRMASPGVLEKISERTKIALADPDVKARQRSGLIAAFADPALRERVSVATKLGMARPEIRAKIVASMERARIAKLEALRAAWARADKRTRREFLAELEVAT